jgi:hypothetical protein
MELVKAPRTEMGKTQSSGRAQWGLICRQSGACQASSGSGPCSEGPAGLRNQPDLHFFTKFRIEIPITSTATPRALTTVGGCWWQ